MGRTRWGVALLLVMVALVGCNDGGGAPGSVAARLRACGLLSEGDVGTLPFYAPTACYRRCLSGGKCGELEAALCGESFDLPLRCDHKCAFECGDGTLIKVEQACDGTDQCEDGSDEKGCPMVECDDGETILGDQRCNGRPDCSDGSDERGCSTFTCDSGDVVPASAQCDTVASCPDGSDEAGCDGFECDGRSLPPEARCDGATHCSDGSDEEGCARITAMCPEAG